MIDATAGFWLYPLTILLALAYQRLSDAELGFLLRCQCYIALHGWLPSNPVELGKVFGVRPTSARKKLDSIREFFVNFEDLSPSLRELIVETFGDSEDFSEKLFMESVLLENADVLVKAKQDKRGGAFGKPSTNPLKVTSSPKTRDGDEDDDDREERGITHKVRETGEPHLYSCSSSSSSPSSPSSPLDTIQDVDFVPLSPPPKSTKSKRLTAKGTTPADPIKEFDLDTVLGTHKAAWQRLIDVFGSANVKPATDAPRIVALLDSGKVTAENLLKSARALRSQRSGPRYMGKLSAWLDSGGHLVCSDPDAHTTSMAPAHRQGAEEAASDQWTKYLKPTGTQPITATT